MRLCGPLVFSFRIDVLYVPGFVVWVLGFWGWLGLAFCAGWLWTFLWCYRGLCGLQNCWKACCMLWCGGLGFVVESLWFTIAFNFVFLVCLGFGVCEECLVGIILTVLFGGLVIGC